MKVYLPVVMNKTKKKVCVYPEGAFDSYVAAIHGLAQ